MSQVPLLVADLDGSDLAALYRDIAVLAEAVSVRIDEGGGGARRLGLGAAFSAVEDGTAHRMQIRYRFDDQVWCDTLMREGGGVRLVRVCEAHLDATC